MSCRAIIIYTAILMASKLNWCLVNIDNLAQKTYHRLIQKNSRKAWRWQKRSKQSSQRNE